MWCTSRNCEERDAQQEVKLHDRSEIAALAMPFVRCAGKPLESARFSYFCKSGGRTPDKTDSVCILFAQFADVLGCSGVVWGA